MRSYFAVFADEMKEGPYSKLIFVFNTFQQLFLLLPIFPVSSHPLFSSPLDPLLFSPLQIRASLPGISANQSITIYNKTRHRLARLGKPVGGKECQELVRDTPHFHC